MDDLILLKKEEEQIKKRFLDFLYSAFDNFCIKNNIQSLTVQLSINKTIIKEINNQQINADINRALSSNVSPELVKLVVQMLNDEILSFLIRPHTLLGWHLNHSIIYRYNLGVIKKDSIDILNFIELTERNKKIIQKSDDFFADYYRSISSVRVPDHLNHIKLIELYYNVGCDESLFFISRINNYTPQNNETISFCKDHSIQNTSEEWKAFLMEHNIKERELSEVCLKLKNTIESNIDDFRKYSANINMCYWFLMTANIN